MRPPPKAFSARRARLMAPSAWTRSLPKRFTTSSKSGWPGAMSWCATSSACNTRAPRRENISATLVLPTAIPPVSATRINLVSQTGQVLCRAGQFDLLSSATHLRRFDGVGHQHGDGQRPYAAGDRRNSAANFGRIRMHVADQSRAVFGEGGLTRRVPLKEFFELAAVGDFVDANINHCCAGLDEVARDHAGAPNGGKQNVALAAHGRQVARLAVTDRDRGVRIEQQHGGGLADNIAAADHNRVLPGNGDAAALQDLDASRRRARHQSRTLRGKIADIDRMKTIHVFLRRNGEQDAFGINLRWQRKLHQDAIYLVAAVEFFHDCEQSFRAHRFRWSNGLAVNAERVGGFGLVADVNFRRWIVAHQHCREAGPYALRRNFADFRRHFVFDFFGDGAAIENARRHSSMLARRFTAECAKIAEHYFNGILCGLCVLCGKSLRRWLGLRRSRYAGNVLSKDLLEIIVCPACRKDLVYSPEKQTLTCTGCKRTYPIEDDIPILLVDRATLPQT